jgi:hypothetical protein
MLNIHFGLYYFGLYYFGLYYFGLYYFGLYYFGGLSPQKLSGVICSDGYALCRRISS